MAEIDKEFIETL